MDYEQIKASENPMCASLRQLRSGLNVNPIVGQYFFVNQDLTFDQAEEACQSLSPGSHMATPTELSILQYDFILPSGDLCPTLFWTIIQVNGSDMPAMALTPLPGGEVEIINIYYCPNNCTARLICVGL